MELGPKALGPSSETGHPKWEEGPASGAGQEGCASPEIHGPRVKGVMTKEPWAAGVPPTPQPWTGRGKGAGSQAGTWRPRQ